MKGEKIFITGGAGFLGKNLVKRLYEHNEITVYSRDESKHYYMKKQFPKVNFIIGDIRNREFLIRKAKGHTIGIFAASLKQIEACNDNYEEASKIIIDGAFNSRLAAEENNFKAACFISTDKSRGATTIYGAMKFVAGEGFISGESNCNLTSLIYCNVMASTGSIIPLIWKTIKNNGKLQLYGTEMTRFLISADHAVDLVLKSMKYNHCNIIPKAKSFKIYDLFEIYRKEFGLKYEVTEPRTGEKIHEIMASAEEVPRMEEIEGEDIYLLHPQNTFKTVAFSSGEYSSSTCCLTIEELQQYLQANNYFKEKI